MGRIVYGARGARVARHVSRVAVEIAGRTSTRNGICRRGRVSADIGVEVGPRDKAVVSSCGDCAARCHGYRTDTLPLAGTDADSCPGFGFAGPRGVGDRAGT